MPDQPTTIFGIRHHGPGCARSLRAALERLAPDVVLVEGPPDAQHILPLIAHEQMLPPVALLIYPPDQPQRAVYYPFTIFSPEWQALRYAAERGIPARFMDLPQAVMLARSGGAAEQTQPDGTTAGETGGTNPLQAAPAAQTAAPDPDVLLRRDPIGALAQAAGYHDRELWWEHQVEQRLDAAGLFEAILEMMGALRAHAGEPDGDEALREAQMRQHIRAAQREGFRRIAVVCGAWHAPALTNPGPAKADVALLARLPRIAVQATWIPWTNSRLSYRSGYGAGIASPGWYEHLWAAPDRAAIRWVAHVARLLRDLDLDASPASVIETVRMAEALAALRDLPMPGLAELNEATLSVLCHGQPAPIALIRDRLEIGDRMGIVPEETPIVPLQRDLAAQQRRLRLPPSADPRTLDLDLRKDTDRERSHLLHRLYLLHLPWGERQEVAGRVSGTFHEIWQLQWQPECAVRLIEANVWGNTVEAAATAIVRQAARDTRELPALAALLDRAILAAVPGAIDYILGCIGVAAALAADVRQLMDALPALARVARYGDVRGTQAAHLIPVIDGLFERALAGLPGACASLDDDAAAAMVAAINAVQESISILDRDDRRGEWHDALHVLLRRERIHGLVRGRCCRLLLEARILDDAELQRLARLALSPVMPPAQAAAWIEGLLQGGALLLLHQEGIWLALDRWLLDLDGDSFTAVLPLLRRAFSGFQPPERRAMGEKVARLSHDGATYLPRSGTGAAGSALNHERAAVVLPVLARILGVPSDPS
jgi:hypothetical protein